MEPPGCTERNWEIHELETVSELTSGVIPQSDSSVISDRLRRDNSKMSPTEIWESCHRPLELRSSIQSCIRELSVIRSVHDYRTSRRDDCEVKHSTWELTYHYSSRWVGSVITVIAQVWVRPLVHKRKDWRMPQAEDDSLGCGCYMANNLVTKYTWLKGACEQQRLMAIALYTRPGSGQTATCQPNAL